MKHRLTLRAVEPDDAELLFTSENDEDSWGDSDTLAPISRKILRDYASGYKADPIGECQLRLMAVDDATGQTVGILDFYEIELLHRRSFVAIYVLPQFRRRGYALDMLEYASRYAKRRLGLDKLAARILISNEASIRLFEKACYRPCATLPEWHFSNGKYSDVLIYVLSLSPHPSTFTSEKNNPSLEKG